MPKGKGYGKMGMKKKMPKKKMMKGKSKMPKIATMKMMK